MVETFLLVLAALFPIVNPPGTALVFLSMTARASHAERRLLARRVAINSFFVMAVAFLLGALVLKFYGISIPVLRVAGGLIVAISGWKLLNEGNPKGEDAAQTGGKIEYSGLAFYPLTLPLTTGPGTIAVLISLGFSRGVYIDFSQEARFVAAGLAATIAMAAFIYVCFAFSDRIERILGRGGTDIAVRLSAFILFCLGAQIVWSGASELIRSVMVPA
jgi:multiple antibiotic resistance protein